MGFFKLENYINVDLLFEKGGIVILNGNRNIGKTYDTWELTKERCWKKNHTSVYMRYTATQLKKFIEKPRKQLTGSGYIVQGSGVYETKTVKTKIGKFDTELIKAGPMVCAFTALNTYKSDKSSELENVKVIFFEEYNEMDSVVIDAYQKFINTIKTFERFNKVVIFLIGNRDTSNNEFMNAFGLEPHPNPEETYVEKWGSEDRENWFIELADSDFADLENEKTLSNELAQYKRSTKRYLDGGYMRDISDGVLNYEKRIRDTFVPVFRIAIQKSFAVYGKFIYNNKVSYVLVSYEDVLFDEDIEYFENVPLLSLDKKSDVIKESSVIDVDDEDNLRNMFFSQFKRHILFFSSFEYKQLLEDFITLRKNIL